jgi:MinD-like ATPase involved in chromosome partitioning or flagellar assembly
VSVPLLTAVTGPWEAPLVRGLEQAPGVVVVRRCADLGDLLAAAAAGHGRAVLLSADLRRLDREALARLAAAGLAVVGVTGPAGSPEEAEQGRRLTALGVRRQVPADAAGGDVAEAVTSAVRDLEDGGATTGPAARAVADPASALAAPPSLRRTGPATTPDAGAPDAGASRRPGRLLAVWGTAGAPGRTTVATTLSAELAGRDLPTLLVDADTWSASVAQVLGLLDEAAGIAAACRAAAAGSLTPERLDGLAPMVVPHLRVLSGLPRAARWPEVGATALSGVWEAARQLVDWTVADCAAPLEQDEELALDTAAPRRNAATLAALEDADAVVVVGSADPVGLQRLVRSLQDLAEVVPTAAPVVVVNRVRSSALGPAPGRRVVEALARYAGVEDPVLVPDDPAACDAALLAGRTLPEAAPSSPARLALRALADRLVEGTGASSAPTLRTWRPWARMRR